MKKYCLALFSLFCGFLLSPAIARKVYFNEVFTDSTLRIDYMFSGTKQTQHIALKALSKTSGWYGRRHHLGEQLLRGNGQLVVLDAATKDTVYQHSFSSLFQEWQNTEEATRLERSFDNSFLIPHPQRPVEVVCTLTDTHNRVTSELRHIVDPKDILIRDRSMDVQTPWRYIWKGGDSRECIDIAIVAEGFNE